MNLISYKSSTSNSITVNIKVQMKLKRNAELCITVYDQARKLSTHQIRVPLPQEYTIEQLHHQKIYTLKVRLENGQENHFQTLHCNTISDSNQVIRRVQLEQQQQIRQQTYTLSEQQLIDVIMAENEDINIFNSRQEVQSLVQRARNNSSARGFIHSEYRVNRPPELRQERLKRIWMISKGQQFFDEVYGNIDPGLQFLKNDWFMGPFYSYDPNEEQLRKAKEEADLHID